MFFSEQQLNCIHDICVSRDVAELYLFGSALHAAKFKETSDFDFAVVFTDSESGNTTGSFDRYMGLIFDLEKLLDRKVDVVSLKSIRNPFFKAEVEKTKSSIFSLNAA